MCKKLLRLVGLGMGLALVSVHARVWTEAVSGKKIDADYVSADAGSVVISLRGGKTFKLELSRLSPEDQAFVRQQQKPADSAKPAAKVEDRFEDVKDLKAAEIPVTGESPEALKKIDEAVLQFMVEKGVPAVTFAVSRNGKVVYDRAFGWADSKLKNPLQPGVKMRIASMTKPVVKAAIQTLVEKGKVKPEDLVFDVLELGQYAEAKKCDPRFKTVTIQHLLDHKGGWDRDKSGDLTTRSSVICELFNVKPDEMKPEHVVRYGLTLPMDFAPGERYAYCNYGYIMLVRVIEKVSGEKFIDYLQNTVCKESNAPSFSLSSTDARDRQAGEIWYCYHPEHPKEEIPLSFRTEARDGAGILACTAADYCRFLETYWISGMPRKPGAKFGYSFAGSHAGVTAICAQRPDGINYAGIANRRGGGKTDWNGDLRKLVDAALNEVASEIK